MEINSASHILNMSVVDVFVSKTDLLLFKKCYLNAAGNNVT